MESKPPLVTTVAARQVPAASQTSLPLHTLPSGHGVFAGFAGFEQAPVLVLQTPASWHWSSAVHVTGLAPVQFPPWHVSVCVQAFPSLHGALFGLAGFEQTPVSGLQTPTSWH
jgi:hypothetical protein